MKLFLSTIVALSLAACTQRSIDGEMPSQVSSSYGYNRIPDRGMDESLVKSDCDDQSVPGVGQRSDCSRYEYSSEYEEMTGR